MDIAKLDDILSRKMAQTREDIERRIEGLRASAGRKVPNAKAIAAVAREIEDLELRLDVLGEMKSLTQAHA